MLIMVFFYLIISYLRIKSYNVLNYNNCSTEWSFPLISSSTFITFIYIISCYSREGYNLYVFIAFHELILVSRLAKYKQTGKNCLFVDKIECKRLD